jgi:thiamine pyrophosphate-dependent acetolactate synthase large subunit-like protein
MEKVGIEFDKEAQKNLAVPLGEREMYPNAGVYVAETLRDHGVTVAFGVPGGHIWQFANAISRIGIKTVTFAHEQNAVYAAEGYAQVSRKHGVCYATVGPGVGNSVSPIHQAWVSKTPILFLAGGHELEHDKLWNTLQESYATELCAGISKWAQRIVLPNTVKQYMTRGLKLAKEYPYGPVVMEIGITCLLTPKDANDRIWYGIWGDHAAYRDNWRYEETAKPLICGGAPDAIAKAVKTIYAAENPIAVIGDGAHWADAGPELTEFLEMAKIPFTTRRLGRGTVSERNPLYHRGMPKFKAEIDLHIAIGAEIGFFDGYGSKWGQTVQIAESADMIYTYVDTTAAVLGNPKVVVQQMLDYVKANGLTPPAGRDEWLKKVQSSQAEAVAKRRAKAESYLDHPRYKENNFMHHGPLSQLTIDYLAEKYEDKVRMFIDGFTMSDFIMPYLVATKSAQILSAASYAGVGHSTGQAVGAALAQIEQGDKAPLLVFMGDGGFGNSMMDIEVAARYKLPIVFQLTSNGGWLTGGKYTWFGPDWELLGEQDGRSTVWNGSVQIGEERLDIDYEAIAKALGCYAETCDRHEDYVAALDRCFKSAENGVPAVLDCIMDRQIVNCNMTSPTYTLMLQHLPWVDLPDRGKRTRRAIWGKEKAIKGLAKYPPMVTEDHWKPYDDDELIIKGEDWPLE